MTSPHSPRPSDFVALVSFDGEEVANQAVTRERLERAQPPARPLAAAIEQWLGRRRRVWVDIGGRQIRGIATARELAGRSAWEIDTLIDASDGTAEDVTGGLLRQAADAAAAAGATRLLLRLPGDAPAARGAQRAGFSPALAERVWTRTALAERHEAPTSGVEARPALPADAYARFQLYNHALPVGARDGLGMTFEEWSAAQERRWAGRGAREYVACEGGQVRGALHVGTRQFTLLVEPGCDASADALLCAASARMPGGHALALLPECAATPASMLRAHGFEPGETYTLYVLRTVQPIREVARARAGRVVVARG
jgi:hypothetical protein